MAAELGLIDQMAQLSQGGDEAFDAQRELYEADERIRVPAVITSHTPGVERAQRVELPG